MSLTENPTILRPSDPAPVSIVNGQSRVPLLLLCEHAGQSIPASLNSLGVSQQVIDSHRGWDIGALEVAREVAARLDAPLVVQNYSRLVIDSNRPPDSVHAMPQEVDGVAIPGNIGISRTERRQRADEIFAPLDSAISSFMRDLQPCGCFSIHSFTPVLGGVPRPWHAGFLSRRDTRTANRLMQAIAARQPDLKMAVNQPYRIEDETDWFIPQHAEPSGARHTLIEIRNDLLCAPGGSTLWADLVAQAITTVMQETKA